MSTTERTAPSVELLPVVREICARYWRTKPKKGADGKRRDYPADDCCHGCPLAKPCGTWTPTSYEGIDAHRTMMNEAAMAAEGK